MFFEHLLPNVVVLLLICLNFYNCRVGSINSKKLQMTKI